MHTYRKILFPVLRERRFVRAHRSCGHKVIHFGTGIPGRCYWYCDCQARHWC